MCLFAQVGVGAGLLAEIVYGNHTKVDPQAAAAAAQLLTDAMHCFLEHPEVLPAIQNVDPKFVGENITGLSAHEMAVALQTVGISRRQQISDEQLSEPMRCKLQALTGKMHQFIVEHHPRVQPGKPINLRAAVRPPVGSTG